jgi:hypothetical protein
MYINRKSLSSTISGRNLRQQKHGQNKPFHRNLHTQKLGFVSLPQRISPCKKSLQFSSVQIRRCRRSCPAGQRRSSRRKFHQPSEICFCVGKKLRTMTRMRMSSSSATDTTMLPDTSATIMPFSAAMCRLMWSDPTPVKISFSFFAFFNHSGVMYAGWNGVVIKA